ncbi:hypothetical protein NDU88_001155 [Pleurodeles waltl]|uniref:Uncharacterized protein n=1 Tax=Pleurodeles waltl TaxID=8319 RepID=A0AAV7V7N9_PLEWA|nr:hypothetical protein NDU88_001155 [Pleurodeles waltl]
MPEKTNHGTGFLGEGRGRRTSYISQGGHVDAGLRPPLVRKLRSGRLLGLAAPSGGALAGAQEEHQHDVDEQQQHDDRKDHHGLHVQGHAAVHHTVLVQLVLGSQSLAGQPLLWRAFATTSGQCIADRISRTGYRGQGIAC